mmetsp:Transcript_34618/g.55334  ORF Transcript_34618/g.55334 Transcript_34618/m.55334 type:complete len:258 (-) Transcript_34618:2227-3000(-)
MITSGATHDAVPTKDLTDWFSSLTRARPKSHTLTVSCGLVTSRFEVLMSLWRICGLELCKTRIPVAAPSASFSCQSFLLLRFRRTVMWFKEASFSSSSDLLGIFAGKFLSNKIWSIDPDSTSSITRHTFPGFEHIPKNEIKFGWGGSLFITDASLANPRSVFSLIIAVGKVFTATRCPWYTPLCTSPNVPRPIHSPKAISLASSSSMSSSSSSSSSEYVVTTSSSIGNCVSSETSTWGRKSCHIFDICLACSTCIFT